MSTPENPTHYNIPGTDKQLIDILKASAYEYASPWEFFLWASVMQYVCRWIRKGTPLNDLKKCRVYLDWLIESVEENGKETAYSADAPHNIHPGVEGSNL